MKKYISPEVEIIELTKVDVIETSGNNGLNNEGAGSNETDEPMEWSMRGRFFD